MIKGACAIFERDIRKFLKSPFFIFMTLIFPLVYLVIFGNAMGGTIVHIPIGVTQDDLFRNETPLYSSTFDALAAVHDPGKPPLFEVTRYIDVQTAKGELATGKILAVLVLPPAVAPDSDIRLYIDSSEYMIPALIQSGISGVLLHSGATNPLLVEKIYGKIEYIQFFGVGVIVMAIFMTTMMGGGNALIRDREMGIIEGYLVTPVKRSSIVLGMIASGTVKAFLAGLFVFLIDIFIAGVPVRGAGEILMVLGVVFIICIGINSLVISFASRFSNQSAYSSVVAFLNLLLFMTSGAFYPIIGMPDWLRWITVINPEAYAVHALRSLILRGQGLEVIGIDLLALAIFSAAAIVIGISSFRRTLD